MPLGQKSFSSKLPRRGWVMDTVTATCSRVLSPDISRSILLTVGGQAVRLGNQPHKHTLTSSQNTLGTCPLKPQRNTHGNSECGLVCTSKWNAVAAFKYFTI